MKNFLSHITERIEFSSQIKDWSCGPAVVQMILKSLGKKRSESELISSMKANPERGTSPSRMVSFLRDLGIECDSKENSSLSEIEENLKNFHVVVLYFLKDWSVDHYALVRSVKGEKITLFDPWYGKDHDYGLSHFEEIWHGVSKFGSKSRWMMRIQKERIDV